MGFKRLLSQTGYRWCVGLVLCGARLKWCSSTPHCSLHLCRVGSGWTAWGRGGHTQMCVKVTLSHSPHTHHFLWIIWIMGRLISSWPKQKEVIMTSLSIWKWWPLSSIFIFRKRKESEEAKSGEKDESSTSSNLHPGWLHKGQCCPFSQTVLTWNHNSLKQKYHKGYKLQMFCIIIYRVELHMHVIRVV